MLLTEISLFAPSLSFNLSQRPQNSQRKCSLRKYFGQQSRKNYGKLSAVSPNGVLHSSPSSLSPFEHDELLQEMSPYFRSLLHPLQFQLTSLLEANDEDEFVGDSDDDNNEGLGILEFFHGKKIFITGATGLLGKAFVEKLLRSTLVGKIYLLMKSEDKEAADDRLNKEIIDSELFTCLREIHGNGYEAYVREKLIAVPGDICEPNLGIDMKLSQEIMKDVDVIVESAASTNLNDRYDSLIDLNVSSTQRMMRFAKSCGNLKLFVHISTAYVCGKKEGLIPEEPLIMGQNGRKNVRDQKDDELFHGLDLADEISVAMKSFRESSSSSSCDNISKNLKQLGQERADLLGYHNAYHMTKALSEMVLEEMRGDTPVLIIRPSVIESTYNDPIPGWIQGNRCFDPVITAYGKGQLPAYLADPQEKMDIIPLDYVVNSTIASIAKHGNEEHGSSNLNVYHVGSGVANPLSFGEFFDILHEYFTSNPLKGDGETIEKIALFDNFRDFSEYTRSEISRKSNNGSDEIIMSQNDRKIRAKIAYAEQLCKLYEFVGFMKGRFGTGKTKMLLQKMSPEEKLEFEIDTRKINWRKYFMESHIPGLEKYLLKKKISRP